MNTDIFKELLDNLVKNPTETEWLEFKVDYFDPERMGQLLSGLANGASLHNQKYGFLVFGVENATHNIVGTSLKPRVEKVGAEELENWLYRSFNPSVELQIFEFNYQEGCSIVIFRIPAAIDRPISFKDTSFIRVGSITKELKGFPEKEKKIWNNSLNKNFEMEIALPSVTGDDVLGLLDYPTYFTLTSKVLPTDKSKILPHLVEDKLVLDAYGRYDITNMGALLFARDLTRFESVKRKSVRVIIYDGVSKVRTIKEQEGIMGYAVGFQGLVEYVKDKLPSNEEIKKALREDKKMYPEIAIRELVANALVHQDLSIRGEGPMVEIFDDRIEISNPGTPLIETDRFIDHSPQSRNEDVASFMRRIKVCEERGSGVDKVITYAEIYQLPAPKFEASENSTKVTLYAPKLLNDMSLSDKIRACYQHCVLKHITGQMMTNSSLRDRFNISEQNYAVASRIIRETLDANLIKIYQPEKNSKKHIKYVPIWA